MLFQHFLIKPPQNPPLQPIDFQLRLKISQFPALGGPKCRRREKTPSERVDMRKVLTILALLLRVGTSPDYWLRKAVTVGIASAFIRFWRITVPPELGAVRNTPN